MASTKPHMYFSFIFIVFISFDLCYSFIPHNDNNKPLPPFAYDDSRPFPSLSFTTCTVKDIDSKFNSMINLRAGIPGRKLAASVQIVNVIEFGARGDGKDDTLAFQKAWERACSSNVEARLVVPKNKYLVKPIRFTGPCRSHLTLQIYGSIEASNDRKDYEGDDRHWIVFESVQNLIVDGGKTGTINGNGQIWWQNSCKTNKAFPCKDAPTAITFYKCNNLVVKNLRIQDAQKMHVSFENCMKVEASNLIVTAPENSPNTDGIHVTNSQNIKISGSTIATGDDCISIVSGSQEVQATDITCGPGHGISIGSLGEGNSEAYVTGVTVNRAKLLGTANGVRIKTWQGGSGSASNIKFLNIEMQSVTNPIIIDQNYCDKITPCKPQRSAVQVKNVLYQNIKGTSASDIAINFDCSKSFACQGIVLQDINLKQNGRREMSKALCNNVQFDHIELVTPRCP